MTIGQAEMHKGQPTGRALSWSIRASDRLIHKAATLIGCAGTEAGERSARRSKECQVGEVYTREGISVVHRGFLSMSLMRSLELNMCWPVLDQMRSPVLDIGCGNGVYARLAFRAGSQIVDGVDMSQLELKRAQDSEVYRTVYLANASQGIPLCSGAYNGVFSNSVFEHIPNITGVIRESSRVLSPGGYLVFTTYGPRLVEYIGSFFGCRDAEYMNRAWSHTTLITFDEYKSLLEQHGFRTVTCDFYLTAETTRFVRLLSSKVIQTVELMLGALLWYVMREPLRRAIAESIYTCADKSAGMLVVAQKAA